MENRLKPELHFIVTRYFLASLRQSERSWIHQLMLGVVPTNAEILVKNKIVRTLEVLPIADYRGGGGGTLPWGYIKAPISQVKVNKWVARVKTIHWKSEKRACLLYFIPKVYERVTKAWTSGRNLSVLKKKKERKENEYHPLQPMSGIRRSSRLSSGTDLCGNFGDLQRPPKVFLEISCNFQVQVIRSSWFAVIQTVIAAVTVWKTRLNGKSVTQSKWSQSDFVKSFSPCSFRWVITVIT